MNSIFRSFIHYASVLLFLFFWSGSLNSQTILHCGDSFFDSGGANGNYSSSENITWQICPQNPGEAVRVVFSSFVTENSWDRLVCYNGPSTSSPVLGNFTGNMNANLPGGVNGVVSTDLSGCLTFRFTSDGSGVYQGWEAAISCAPQCMPPTLLSISNIGVHNARLSWNAPLNGSPAAGYEYEVRTSGNAGSGSAGLVFKNTIPLTPNNTVISDLNGNTNYTVYLRSRCGSADSSLWSSGVNFLTLPGCASTFNDPGGVSGNYPVNIDSTWVICPDNNGDAVQVIFSQFGLQTDDTLFVHNGNSTSAALIGKYTGAGLLKAPGAGAVTANNNSGCLTFRLKSNASGTSIGWLATVVCNQGPVTCLSPTGLAVSDVEVTTARISWLKPAFTTPSGYEYQIRTSGMPGDTAGLVFSGTVSAPDTSALLSELIGNTGYVFFVRSNCGNNNHSAWTVVPVGFRTKPGCGSTFTDSGGENGNYNNNENTTYLICPENPGEAVRVIFSSFVTENSWDRLVCYNGPSTSSPVLGNYTGNMNANLPGGVNGVVSTDLGGCLTFRFTSDGSGVYPGWDATISCTPQCMPPTQLHVSNITVHTVQLNWNPAETGMSSAGYQYEIRTSGAAGSGAIGFVASDTLASTPTQTVINNLLGNTAYTVYLRSRCDSVSNSLWTPGVNFITLPGCGSTFNDPGGVSANYLNNTDTTWVICPDNAGNSVQVTFSQFNLQTGDTLRVYVGNSISSNLIGGFSGSGLLKSPGAGVVVANNQTGCLTFRFKSDASGVAAGWLATVECLKTVTCLGPTGLSITNITSNSALISWQKPSFTTPEFFEYEIRTSGAPGSGTEGLGTIGIVDGTNTSIQVNSFFGNTQYTVYLRSKCSESASAWTLVPFVFRTLPGCGSSFTDSGGPDGNYQNGENTVYQLCPETPGDSVRVIFNSFVTENSWDRLACYNGPGTSSPLLGSFTGNLNANLPGGTEGLVSTDPSGCLTFRFTSDGSGVYAGWNAQVVCRRVCAPAVYIQSVTGGNVCEGSEALFTAIPMNGGSNPAYQWRKNGVPVGTDSSIFSSTTLQNNDVISVLMTSSETCATPDTVSGNSITVQLQSALVPAANIQATPGINICEGQEVELSLVTNITGANVQWLRNNLPVGHNELSYGANNWTDGEQVSAILWVPEQGCYTVDSVITRILEMDVNQEVPVGNISISGSAEPSGNGTYKAVYQAEIPSGITSYRIEWYVNGSRTVSISNQKSWEHEPFTADSVFAILYAESGCYNPDSSISNEVTVLNPTGIASVSSLEALKVYPNPFSNTITVEGVQKGDILRINDISGRIVKEMKKEESDAVIQLHLGNLSPGIYLLHLDTSSGTRGVFRLQKQ